MNFNRYLKICAWAYRRYTHHGRTVLYQGPHKMQYLRIEEAAWYKYATINHHGPRDGASPRERP